MDDTTPEMAEKIRVMMRRKSPTERVKMGCSMHKTSKYLMTCAILEINPHISQAALRQELFLRFYGNDFSPEERKKICNHLEKHFIKCG